MERHGAGLPPKSPGQRVRRNVLPPSKEDKMLPASGRKGRAPDPPVELGEAGMTLWRTLWASPQATLWTRSDHQGIAMRCQLQDMWAADPELKVYDSIQKWEDRWGFTPKSRMSLHMWLSDDENPGAAPQVTKTKGGITDIRDRLKDAAG